MYVECYLFLVISHSPKTNEASNVRSSRIEIRLTSVKHTCWPSNMVAGCIQQTQSLWPGIYFFQEYSCNLHLYHVYPNYSNQIQKFLIVAWCCAASFKIWRSICLPRLQSRCQFCCYGTVAWSCVNTFWCRNPCEDSFWPLICDASQGQKFSLIQKYEIGIPKSCQWRTRETSQLAI